MVFSIRTTFIRCVTMLLHTLLLLVNNTQHICSCIYIFDVIARLITATACLFGKHVFSTPTLGHVFHMHVHAHKTFIVICHTYYFYLYRKVMLRKYKYNIIILGETIYQAYPAANPCSAIILSSQSARSLRSRDPCTFACKARRICPKHFF